MFWFRRALRPGRSFAIQLGGWQGREVSAMPPEWNYLVRLNGPRPEILNAAWTFPEPQAAK
jgi:hypothetical protein